MPVTGTADPVTGEHLVRDEVRFTRWAGEVQILGQQVIDEGGIRRDLVRLSWLIGTVSEFGIRHVWPSASVIRAGAGRPTWRQTRPRSSRVFLLSYCEPAVRSSGPAPDEPWTVPHLSAKMLPSGHRVLLRVPQERTAPLHPPDLLLHVKGQC